MVACSVQTEICPPPKGTLCLLALVLFACWGLACYQQPCLPWPWPTPPDAPPRRGLVRPTSG